MFGQKLVWIGLMLVLFRGPKEIQDLKGLRVSKVHREKRVNKGKKVTKDLRVVKETKESKDLKVKRATRETKESKDPRVLRGLKVHRAYRVFKDLKENKDLKVTRVTKVRMARPHCQRKLQKIFGCFCLIILLLKLVNLITIL